MENSNRRVSKEKKHPRVPIKTYRWEDVRRSRKRGGYPWTYLYKQPLGDDMDPLPNSKQTTDQVEGSREPSEWEELELEEAETIEDVHQLSDTPRHLKNSCSSLGVSQRSGIFFLDSAESSDDISQYLDKDEPAVVATKEAEVQVPTEQAVTRKRKVSEGSNHSKMSLSKSMMMKKLKEAKAKIKVPKISIPTSKFRKTIPKKSGSPPKAQPPPKERKAAREVTPVYIHIPLKAPPGEADSEESKKVQPKKLRSFKDAVKGIKHMYEDQKEIATISEEAAESNGTTNSEGTKPFIVAYHQKTAEQVEDYRRNEEADMEESLGGSGKSEPNIEDVITHDERATGNVPEQNEDPDMEASLGPNEKLADHFEDSNKDQEESSKEYNEMFDDLFKASSSIAKKDTEPSDRTKRSKSAEPERKRKMSLESSYSRKSLSKLGLLKKLKNASDKIKKAFSRPNLKQEKDVTVEAAPEKTKEKKKGAPVAPVYIYIPLKDENADEVKPETKDRDEVATPESDLTTPEPGKVELIILTAPSDDEILDYNSSDVPDTPSSESKPFFGNKTELKELAKGAIDGLSDKEKEKLLTVQEEAVVEEIVPTRPGEVELIMVTAPTDDELLDDDSSDVPETPSSENNLVFELKELAKGAIATSSTHVLPPKTDHTSAKIDEKKIGSSGLDNASSAAVSRTLEDPLPEASIPQAPEPEPFVLEPAQPTSILVDEEDGLNETKLTVPSKESDVEEDLKILEAPEAAKLQGEDTLPTSTEETTPPDDKSMMRKEELSPKLKKKVSFRKKAKVMRDGSYEDVEVPQGSFEDKDAGGAAAAEDDKKTLDAEAVRLPPEEDNNKWSKTSDHEYEPVNPPPEDFVMIPCSTMAQTTKIFNIALDRPIDDTSHHQSSEIIQEHPDDHSRSVTPEPAAAERKSSLHKFQTEFKRKTQDLKGRFHAMKKPHISLPARPVFHKPNFKMDKAKQSFQHIKNKFPSLKPSVKRHHSTESNDGDAKKTIFSTYPRIFKRKSARCDDERVPEFATVPRSQSRKVRPGEPIRISLQKPEPGWHGGEPERTHRARPDWGSEEPEATYVRGESLEELGPSRFGYSEDIEHDDDDNGFEYNGDDSLGRWDRGTFVEEHPNRVVTDLDLPEEQPMVRGDHKDRYSSGSSNGGHKQGVLEEIDSDEFFLRQKGISQDNIEVGMYLSSEIRDAFRTPVNALSQMQQPEYNLGGSTHSIPEVSPKRKPIKKPKRKKTPHVSQERIETYEEDSPEDDEEGIIPPRPTRNSRRSRKPKTAQEDLIPYQETISVDDPHDRLFEHRESLAVLGDDERDEEAHPYENGGMAGKEQPDISVTDYIDENGPAVPPRKQKSLKSLNFSENDSILGRAYSEENFPRLEAIRTESKIIIPIPTEVPERPSRSRSRKNLANEDSFIKITDRLPYADEPEQTFTKTITLDHHYLPETHYKNVVDDPTMRTSGALFEKAMEPPLVKSEVVFTNDMQYPEPCVEQICKQDIRDCMGYAVIDKSKARDPPLPPPRIPKRRKKPLKAGNNRFATVQATPFKEKSPIRPLRNYSTLGQMKKSSPYADDYENEENIDITQYVEIDDDTKKLQSGDVIQKMKDRPLPAPPRPPRKSRPLHDIASEENIMVRLTDVDAEEAEVSTQTEPLPDDFECEEVVQEPTDTVIIPTQRRRKQSKPPPDEETLEDPTNTIITSTGRHKREIGPDEGTLEEPTDTVITSTERPTDFANLDTTEAERSGRKLHLITPTLYTHEETITHGSLLVEPLDGAEILANPTQRRIPVYVESNDEETSSIPEEFNALTSPPEEPIQSRESSHYDIPKQQSPQLRTLDIDTLKVNTLLADKIVVSELDAGAIKTNEISSETGNVLATGLSLPPELIKEMLRTIQSDQAKDEEAVKVKSTGAKTESCTGAEIIHSVGKGTCIAVGEAKSSCANDEEAFRSGAAFIHSVEEEMSVNLSEPNIVSTPIQDEESRLQLESDEVEASSGKEDSIPEAVEIVTSTPSTVTIDMKSEAPPTVEPNIPPRPPRQSERHKPAPQREEPEVDDEPPPRPPQPQLAYVPSQPPASFYALKAEQYLESVSDSVPLVPRRRRHTKSKHLSRSSSDESSAVTLQRRRSHRRSSSPSLAELSSTLLRVCGGEINGALKRLVTYVLSNVRRNDDGKQDLNVMIIIMLVMIAGLILLGYGEEKTVVHLHHWDYFNPPTNM